jgi:hypothetical protein
MGFDLVKRLLSGNPSPQKAQIFEMESSWFTKAEREAQPRTENQELLCGLNPYNCHR